MIPTESVMHVLVIHTLKLQTILGKTRAAPKYDISLKDDL